MSNPWRYIFIPVFLLSFQFGHLKCPSYLHMCTFPEETPFSMSVKRLHIFACYKVLDLSFRISGTVKQFYFSLNNNKNKTQVQSSFLLNFVFCVQNFLDCCFCCCHCSFVMVPRVGILS